MRENKKRGEEGKREEGGGGQNYREKQLLACALEKSHFLSRIQLSLEEDAEYLRT